MYGAVPGVPVSEDAFICEGLEFDRNLLKEKGIYWFIDLKWKTFEDQSIIYTSVTAGVVG